MGAACCLAEALLAGVAASCSYHLDNINVKPKPDCVTASCHVERILLLTLVLLCEVR